MYTLHAGLAANVDGYGKEVAAKARCKAYIYLH